MTALLLLIGGCQGLSRPKRLSEDAEDLLLGVPKFSEVCEGLYRGGQPTEAGYEVLRKRGIRTIVSLRTFEGDLDRLQQRGFRTYHISCNTGHPETEDVLEFLSLATDPANRPLFVHCRRGADRTGMMVAAYRMVVQDWPRARAIREMREMGFSPWNMVIDRYVRNVDVAQLKQELADRLADRGTGGNERGRL